MTRRSHPPKIRLATWKVEGRNPTSAADVFAALVAARRASDRAARDAERASLPAARRLADARAIADATPGDSHAYAAVRQAEAHARSESLDWHVERLRTLLAEIKPISFDFDVPRAHGDAEPFDAGGLDIEEPPPQPPALPSEPSGLLGKVLPSSRARHESAVADANAAYERMVAEHREREERRKQMLADALAEHERRLSEAQSSASTRNREVDAVRAKVEAGEPDALVAYFAAILAAGDYPDGFPRRATVALDPKSRILVVDYELPGLDAVPAVQAYRYDVTLDAYEDVPRPAARRKDLYALVVASVSLRSVAELFEADRTRAVDEIGFNGYVHGVDRVTGEAVRPYLVSMRTTRAQFARLEIAKTDPIVTIRSIEAAFSTNPAELAPVRQVVGAKVVGTAHLASSPDV